jgi:hypothetical protein
VAGMKYYIYISEGKVEMLYSQLKEASTPETNRKYKIGVSGTGAEFGFHSKDLNIYQKIERVLSRLKRDNAISNVRPKRTVDLKLYYKDTGNWHNGMFSISHFSKAPQATTYALLRNIGSNLILLIGSPMNIIGKVDKSASLQMPDSSGGVMAFLRLFTPRYMKDNDLSGEFQSAEPPEQNQRQPFSNHHRYAEEFWGFFGYELEITKQEDRQRYIHAMISFCLSDIALLPQTPIECLFKLYSTWTVKDTVKGQNDDKPLLKGISTFSVGSPLYTAIPS